MGENLELDKILCERIKYLRLQSGLTIEKLAYQSDISKGGLSEIERNMKEPRNYTILKICAALNITLKEFFDFKEIDDLLEKLK